jgi:hypothetical protein
VGALPQAAPPAVEPHVARRARRLAIAVGIELVLGIMTTLSVAIDRPSGWVPSKGQVVYLVHAGGGLFITLGALLLVLHLSGTGRIAHIVGWMGLVSVALAGLGGLLTAATSLVRLLGIALMFVGTVGAGLSYLIPTFVRRQQRAAVTGLVVATGDAAPAAPVV